MSVSLMKPKVSSSISRFIQFGTAALAADTVSSQPIRAAASLPASPIVFVPFAPARISGTKKAARPEAGSRAWSDGTGWVERPCSGRSAFGPHISGPRH
jgi:hypothetical protein